MKNNLSCPGCSYFWKNADDIFPFCHWRSQCPDDIAPCEEVFEEEDEDFYEDEDEPDLEMGFDPFVGSYTDDC